MVRSSKPTTDKDPEPGRATILHTKLESTRFGDPLDGEQLASPELWWSQHYQWFKDNGYLLRPRYAPDWVPSWRGTKKNGFMCEDGRVPYHASKLLDGTRLSDGAYVALKIVKPSKNRNLNELEVAKFLTSEPLQSNPSNHCVPIYDILPVPGDGDLAIMVMPLLLEYTSPQFCTVGEAVECFRQLFEGLQFMHKNRTAHRDCTHLNIMMDGSNLCIDAFHPVDPIMKRDFSGFARFKTRTERPPKYYFIDFSLSCRFNSIFNAFDLPAKAGDSEVPELLNYSCPSNPFPIDVFCMGNTIKRDFLVSKRGLEFMQPLVADMVQIDPSKRPTMDEVVERFETIRGGLGKWKLRSRVVDLDQSMLKQIFGTAWHWVRQLEFMARRLPALPRPPP